MTSLRRSPLCFLSLSLSVCLSVSLSSFSGHAARGVLSLVSAAGLGRSRTRRFEVSEVPTLDVRASPPMVQEKRGARGKGRRRETPWSIFGGGGCFGGDGGESEDGERTRRVFSYFLRGWKRWPDQPCQASGGELNNGRNSRHLGLSCSRPFSPGC